MGFRKEIIGDCTLYCGDALKIAKEIIGDFDAVVTDPPYGMTYKSRGQKWKNRPIANDDDSGCLKWACKLSPIHSSYVFCRWDNLVHIPQPKSLITWVKNNHGIGDCLHSHGRQTEVIAFYPGSNHNFPRYRPTDVIKCAKTQNRFHPTEKPIGLMTAIVEWSGGTVLDPFMGSGSTGVACANLKRSFVGIELDSEHFETSCSRIHQAYSNPPLFMT